MEEESGYSRNSIINWETGVRVPRADILLDLAKLLNTTAAYLLGETEDFSLPTHINTVENHINMRENSPLINIALAFEILKRNKDMSTEEKEAIGILLSACQHELLKNNLL